MDRLTPAQRRRNMQAVRSTGSRIENTLASALWRLGLRYRRNDKTVIGRPDIVFRRQKVAIFVDGEFWHGRNWEVRKRDHKSNITFWHRKIERNIARDMEVNDKLLKTGWKVLRFWGKDVTENLQICVERIQRTLDDKQDNASQETSSEHDRPHLERETF